MGLKILGFAGKCFLFYPFLKCEKCFKLAEKNLRKRLLRMLELIKFGYLGSHFFSETLNAGTYFPSQLYKYCHSFNLAF